jgi:ribokinase
MNIAIVGHIEWGTFLRVPHLPAVGESVYAIESWQEVCGGGSVAALQAAAPNTTCTFFTAIGNDEFGRRSVEQLEKNGVKVYASVHNEPQTKSYIHIGDNHNRTITVVERFKPTGTDRELPWEKLAEMDAVYFVSGDEQALTYARQAKIVVSTARVATLLNAVGLPIDVVVTSVRDNLEVYKDGDISPKPGAVVITNGASGGRLYDGATYSAEVVQSEKIVDFYGCGDSFAAGLTYGLGLGLDIQEALKVATHAGATAARRRGAFGN